MCAEGVNQDTMLWENAEGKPNHAWDISVLILLAEEILSVALWEKPEEAEIDEIEKSKQEPSPNAGGQWIRNGGGSWLGR